MVQLAAARALGADRFGALVLLVSCLVLCTALYTAFVGDALTVLGRDDPAVRGAVLVAHGVLVTSAAGVGFGVAVGLAGLGPGVGAAYAGLIVLWLHEELGRRALMAGLSFWKLAANDAGYVAVTLLTLTAAGAAGMTVSLLMVILAMGAGAAVAVGLALGQLPLAQLRPARPTAGLVRDVAGFAVWRSLQAGLTPALLFTARVLISAVAGRGVLGQVEAARLMVAPAQTVVAAAGNVLLPAFAADGTTSARRARRASAALIGATVLVGAAALLLVGPFADLVVGPGVEVPRTAVLAWSAYCCALAAGLPAATALVARRRTRTVFLAWLGDALVGVTLVVVILAAGHPVAVPVGLAVARLGSALCLHVLASRADEQCRSRSRHRHRHPGWTRSRTGARSLRPPGTVAGAGAGAGAGASAGAGARRLPRLLPSPNRWALAAVVLPLMLASDYKVRLRGKEATTSGQADLFILAEMAVYATVGVVLLLTVARAPAQRRNATVVVLAWVFGSYCALSVVWSPYGSLAVVRAAQLLLTVAVAQTAARYASRAQLHGLAHAFAATVAGSVLFGALHRFPPVSGETAGRFTWLYVHPVVAGIYLGAATVILTVYLTRPGREHRIWPTWTYQVLLVVVGSGLLASRTRGALGGAVVAALLAMVCGARGARRLDLLATIGVFTAIAAVTSLDVVLSYLSRGESAEKLATLNERTNLWSLALDAFEQKPMTGWGLTASRGIFLDAIGLGGGHNAFVNVLVDGGAIGALLWLALLGGIVVALRGLWRRIRPDERADLTLLTALLLFLLFDGLTAEHMAAPANVANILLAVIVGWTGALTRRRAGSAGPAPERGPVTAGRPAPERGPVPPGRPVAPGHPAPERGPASAGRPGGSGGSVPARPTVRPAPERIPAGAG
ncbi:O-antigen ligase [Parafrankia irregularis]|uniref:O-antigen ligase n=1 Tax=Parafrankia irregularis TaxID=795642 RepID=A0A0S4QKS7_9ACTN|nr:MULTISPECIES: O-antigen ligase family protein [Parafrankia]CUU55404.1 O-antigen ligase [Parafrankia irregularis]